MSTTEANKRASHLVQFGLRAWELLAPSMQDDFRAFYKEYAENIADLDRAWGEDDNAYLLQQLVITRAIAGEIYEIGREALIDSDDNYALEDTLIEIARREVQA